MCDKHHFVFEFDKAYNHQLIEKFEASTEHPLTPDVAQPLKGVYALYHKGELVYAGKALETTLARRLAEHYRKIASRQNIDVSEMSCRTSRRGRFDPALLTTLAEERIRQPRAGPGAPRHSDQCVGHAVPSEVVLPL